MSEFAERMLLAGYVTLTKHGFALPAYGAGARPNVWNVAVPTIDGDHAASISYFEMLESEEVEPLAEDRCIEVYTGDPWHEVFLWDDEIFIGTIEQIYRDTQRLHEAIEAKAPLTMLDLSLAAQGEGTANLAKSASRFLNDRLGFAVGQDMFAEVVIRPSALLALRKQHNLSRPGSEFPELLHEFSISTNAEGSFSIELPKGSLAAIGGLEAAIEFDAAIDALSERLGTSILALENGKALASEAPTTLPEEPSVIPASFPQILVIVLNRRAAQIGRYLRIPTEILMKTGAHVRTAVDDELLVGATQSSLTIVSHIPNTFELDEYETIIWVLDNEALTDTGQLEYITDMVAHLHGDAVTLLAPAPPENAPTAIVQKLPGIERLLDQFDAVIDTTLARSPFWNTEKYSSDRQMADIIMRIAVALTADLDSRDVLLHRRRGEQHRLLSLQRGFPQGYDAVHSAYSELLANSLDGSSNSKPLASFSVRDRSRNSSEDFFISLKDMQIHFETFATAVISGFFKESGLTGAFGLADMNEAISSLLDFPGMAAAFSIRQDNIHKEIVLTAEAPSLGALKTARGFDLAVLRYTDSAALHRIMFIRHDNGRGGFRETEWYDSDGTLPNEIALPTVHIPDVAIGLVTRGIDPRDILRISEARWMELTSLRPASAFESKAYVYRGSVNPRTEERFLAIPNFAIAEAADAGDPLAKRLADEISPRWKAEDRYSRRSFRKFEAWSQQNGATRWLVAEAFRTMKLDVLAPGQLPSQRFMVIEGDVSVPMALRSRPFAVWVRAMAPRMHGTFRLPVGVVESFPFPRFLQFRHSLSGTPQLYLREELHSEGSFAELLDSWSRFEPYEFTRDELSHQNIRLLNLFNALSLKDLELPEYASDLDILDQLIKRNGQG
jgi:hypothetical protein